MNAPATIAPVIIIADVRVEVRRNGNMDEQEATVTSLTPSGKAWIVARIGAGAVSFVTTAVTAVILRAKADGLNVEVEHDSREMIVVDACVRSEAGNFWTVVAIAAGASFGEDLIACRFGNSERVFRRRELTVVDTLCA